MTSSHEARRYHHHHHRHRASHRPRVLPPPTQPPRHHPRYWPTAQTLSERYVNSTQPVSEQTIWSYLVQLSSALRTVHASNLACRCVSASHVLVTTGSRVRLGGVGVVDVLEYGQMKSLQVG